VHAPRHGRRLLAIALSVAGSLVVTTPAHAGLVTTGLTNDNRIVTFDSAAPGTLLSSTPINTTPLGAVAAAAGGLRDIALSGATAPATPGPAPMTPGPLPTPVVDVAPG
jgi:hypothetical protein